jgi:hypothetical protein
MLINYKIDEKERVIIFDNILKLLLLIAYSIKNYRLLYNSV